MRTRQEVYACGQNGYGQMGGKTSATIKPEALHDMQKEVATEHIKIIIARDEFTIVLTGKLFKFSQ